MRSLSIHPTLAAGLGAAILLGACGAEAPETASTAGTPVVPVATPSTSPAAAPVVMERVVPVPPTYTASEAAFGARRYDEARRGFEAYVEREPANGWGWYMLGLSSWKAGNREAALVAFDSALARDPGHLKSLHNSTRVLIEMDRAREAVERARTAVATDSADTEGHRLLGRALHSAGDAEGAVAAYRQALVLDSRDLWSLNNLGVLYLDQGMLEEAVGPLALAAEVNPRGPVFHNNLGSALERLGDLAGARDAYARAVAADSGYAKAVTSLARVTPLVPEDAAPTIDLADRAELFELTLRLRREAATADSVPY